MPCCVFFGHKDTDPNIVPKLRVEIVKLIQEKGVNAFLIGNNGRFDYYVYSTLKELKTEYPTISFSVVLAYLPCEKSEYGNYYSDNETCLPEGIEFGSKRFAIERRNRWMIDHADYVITHVTHGWGGAAKFKELSEKKKKTVINIE